MDIEIREFITYLHNTKKTSANTEISYQRDLKKMAEFLKERGIRNYKDVKELELEGYISYMEREKFASSKEKYGADRKSTRLNSSHSH